MKLYATKNFMSKMLLCSLVFCGIAKADEFDICLTQITNPKQKFFWVKLQYCTTLLENSFQAENVKAWEKIKAGIIDDELSRTNRLALLRMSCKKADEQMASQLIAIGNTWAMSVENARLSNKPFSRGSRAAATSSLLEVLISDGFPSLQKLVHDQRPVLELASKVASGRILVPFTARAICCQVIADSAAPIKMKQDAAFQVVVESVNDPYIAEPLCRVLEKSDWNRLRSLVGQPKKDTPFHFGAASVLAQFGDKEIVETLRKWQELLLANGDRRGRASAGAIEYCLWKIDIQQTPERLLSHIASKPDKRLSYRTWAIQRANEMGITKADIRKAILDLAVQVEVNVHGNRWELIPIKQIGLRLNILHDDDLPDVKFFPLGTWTID